MTTAQSHRFTLRAVAPLVILTLGLTGCSSDSEGDDGGDTAATPPDGPSWFRDVTADSGIDFTYSTGASGNLFMPEIMGAGVGLFDFDNDGDLDVYFVNGHANLPSLTGDGSVTNRLYRHETDGGFTDVTSPAGVGDFGYGIAVATGDYDNDGHVDLFVANYGPDILYRNRGDGTFEDVSAAAGIDVTTWSCSSTFLDYDRDGHLDLYITQYVDFDAEKKCFDRAGRPDYCGPRSFVPVTDVLLHNEGDGTFTDVTLASGIAGAQCAGLGVVTADFNDDGWIDIYVANDAYANQMWINQKNGTFDDVATKMGTAYNMHGQPEAGMGVVAADFDNDLKFDLFMTHLGVETNTLYRSMGERGFEDATGQTGLGATSMQWTGFGTCAFDFDHDGDLDIAVANGRVVRGNPVPDNTMLPPWDRFAEPNLMYLNDGAGNFALIGSEARAFCQDPEITRGLAAGDLDGDGDLDLILANIEGPARVLINEMPSRGNWLLLGVVDPRLNRAALGAQVTVQAGERRIVRTVSSGFSYASASDPRVHVGLGAADGATIDVRWPDGSVEQFSVEAVNSVVRLERGQGQD